MRRITIVALSIAGVAAVAIPAGVMYARNSRTAEPSARNSRTIEPSARNSRTADKSDGEAIKSADTLLRKARTESEPAHALEAERVLRAALERNPADYQATRMLATVLLAQHRFRDALAIAERARAMRPDDAWNDGTMGDALLELGEYDKAFAAFDQMAQRKPNASSYARVSYARELQGDLEGAAQMMTMSAQAAGGGDVESQAWHAAQLGSLLLRQGKHDDAEREFKRAEHFFPGHPYARAGMLRLMAARGQYRDALKMVEEDLARRATPELAAWAGDLATRTGQTAQAAEHYARMEALEREGWASEEPQPGALGRLLAERSLKADEALALAEQAARTRSDINTMDAVAWAAFKAGQLDRAAAAAKMAMRTGTRDQRILAHAAAIALATGDRANARVYASRATAGGPFDLLAFDEAQRVLRETAR